MNGDEIFINLNAEVSELDWTNKVGNYPAIVKRSAETNVTARDNEMFAIAGLVSYESTDNIYKVPLLGDLPLLGVMFKSKSKSYVAVETMIFFTPHLVRRTTNLNPTSIIPSQPMTDAMKDMQDKFIEAEKK